MKLKMSGGINIAEARMKEGDRPGHVKRPGPGAATLRPSGKSRKGLLRKSRG